MKLYFLFFLLILNTASTFGQKQFEGIIIYKNVSKFDTSKNGIIKVFLKKNKMLVSNEFKRNEEPFYTLYDFEKGKNFVSIPSDSVVISTGLTKSPLKEIIDSSKNKEAILGYNCSSTSYKLYSNIESYICKIDAFFSDKLLYKVPNNMRFIAGSGIFFNDSSISLAAKISGFQTPGSVINNIEVAI